MAMLWRIFKPRQKVEGFRKLATVMQAPCDGRQIFQTNTDMPGLSSKMARRSS
jgi:hypothetical protein